MEDALGFCMEYMTRFEPTSRRVWDKEEAQSMYDKVVESGSIRRPISESLSDCAYSFVLLNAAVFEGQHFLEKNPFVRMRGAVGLSFAFQLKVAVIHDCGRDRTTM